MTKTRSPRQETMLWYETAWPARIPDDAKLGLWTLPDKATRFLSPSAVAPATALAELAQDITVGRETYVGVSAIRRDYEPPLGKNGRGKYEDMRYAAGVVLDLDLAGPGRKKQRLFVSVEEVAALLERLPLPPTMTVSSGYGIQVWWIGREPFPLTTEAERAAYERISVGWSDLAARLAREMGREIDAVWDATRVMRLPGTYNRKSSTPVMVRVASVSKSYFNAEDIAQHIVARVAVPGSRGEWTKRAGSLIVAAGAAPPLRKLELLLELDTRFRATWERRRKDLKDTSPSAYNLALADAAAMAGWNDQEITDLLIAWREKHGEDLKLREDYYARTIEKARQVRESDRLAREIEEDGVDPASEDDKSKTFALIKNLTGVALKRIIRNEDGDTYSVVARNDDRVRYLGSAAKVMEWKTWVELAFDCGEPTPNARPKGPTWLAAISALQRFIEQSDEEDTSTAEWFEGELRAYAAGAADLTHVPMKERERTLSHGLPFIEGESLAIQFASFHSWLATRRGSRVIDRPVLREDLKRAGFTRRFVSTGTGGTGRRYWFGPLDQESGPRRHLTLVEKP